MDSFEFNKIAGAVLFTVLIVLGVQNFSHILYEPHEPEQQAYVVEGVVEPGAEGTATETEEPEVSLAALLAEASADKGEKVAKKCASCHTFDKGGRNGTGPNLYNVVGAERPHLADFNYSTALASLGGTWSYESLNAFLESPKDYAPGTAMSFIGLRKPKDRANLIAYLRQQSDNPPPLPAVEEAPAEEAPAE